MKTKNGDDINYLPPGYSWNPLRVPGTMQADRRYDIVLTPTLSLIRFAGGSTMQIDTSMEPPR